MFNILSINPIFVLFSDLAMAGLLSKNEGDDGDRSSFSGFKITLGMLRKLRAEVSTEQTQIPSHDYVEHPLLLSTDIWYKASVNISYSWIQIYVNDIPGPVRYGNFAFVDNYGTFDIGQDVCCGEDRYRFVGSIKDIILYSDVESEPDIKTSVEMDNSDVVDHKIGAIALGIVMVIVTIGIFGYIRFDKEWQADDLKRMRQMHQAFVPPEKQKGSPAYKYEQARLAEEKRKREFKNAPQFYEKTLN